MTTASTAVFLVMLFLPFQKFKVYITCSLTSVLFYHTHSLLIASRIYCPKVFGVSQKISFGLSLNIHDILRSTGLFLICLQYSLAGSKAPNQKFNPGIPQGWQESSYLNYHHCLPRPALAKEAGVRSWIWVSNSGAKICNMGHGYLNQNLNHQAKHVPPQSIIYHTNNRV